MQHGTNCIATLGLALLIAAGAGCGDDDSGGAGGGGATGGSGGTGDTGGMGGFGATGGDGASGGSGGAGGSAPGISISGKVWEVQAGGGAIPPVHDAEVCFVTQGAEDLCGSTLDHPDNQNYDKGAFEIVGVPMNTAGAVRFSGPTVSTFYWVFATESEDLVLEVSIDVPAITLGYYDQAGLVRDPGGVAVFVELYPTKKPDYVAVLTPMSGEGPFYVSKSGVIDLAATATTASIAQGMFLNVDPVEGPFTASFTNGGPSCEARSNGGAVPAWSIPADADSVYMGSFDCP